MSLAFAIISLLALLDLARAILVCRVAKIVPWSAAS